MSDSTDLPTDSRSSILAATPKTAQPKTRGAASPPSHREVYDVLTLDDETHSAIADRFRALGGNATRWGRADLLVMADALTQAEDALELRADTPARRVLRLRLRGLRRRLEDGGVSNNVLSTRSLCARAATRAKKRSL